MHEAAVRSRVRPICLRDTRNPSSHPASQYVDTLDEILKMQNAFVLSWSHYWRRNLGKILESMSSSLASNITRFIATQNYDDFSTVIPRPQQILAHMSTMVEMSLSERWYCFTKHGDFCFEYWQNQALLEWHGRHFWFYTGYIKIPLWFPGHWSSKESLSFSPGSPQYCWKSLLRAHENNFLLWCWMPAVSDFDVIWNKANTPQVERENLLSPLTC